MDDEERKRKLEEGKAKLASFRKKRKSSGQSSKGKKKKAQEKDSISASPRTDEALKSANAGDSTAVQTGSDHLDKGLMISEESDVSTTADEISTEEEASYSGGLSPRERIQELELTVSDQQIALHKLTLENKELRDREAGLKETLQGRDAVIGELRENVSQTASHVKQLQENLSSATESVKASDGDQNEIVAQLMQARQELNSFTEALQRREEAMKQMAVKLQEKSIEAEEAHEVCRSLKVELEKTMQTQTFSSGDTELVLQRIRSELEEQHGKQIALMKLELDRARREADHARHEAAELHKREEKRLLESEESLSSEMDASDFAALQEQVQQLSSQLEASFRNADKEKREHDKEVVKLNQKLISSIDDYEEKLHAEKEMVADLEGRLDMSDTVSSEIQASFSKQLQQLEEERDALKSQIREAQGAVIENAATAKIVEDLDDQLSTYKAEIEETEKRLEERNKQNRKYHDELDRRKDELLKQEKENSKLVHEISSLKNEMDGLREKMEERRKEFQELSEKHAADIEALESEHKQKMENALQDAARRTQEEIILAKEDVKAEMEGRLQRTRDEHSDELKNLNSQHHRQMEELKTDLESKLQGVKEALEQEKKEQLGAVKDVHERSREREFMQLSQSHEEDVGRIRNEHDAVTQSLVEEHEKELNVLKERMMEERVIEENRIRREMEEDFRSKVQELQEELQRQKEKDLEQLQQNSQEKHLEEMKLLQSEYATKSESQEDALSKENEVLEAKLQSQAEEQRSEIENLRKSHDDEKQQLQEEHNSKLTELESEHDKRMEEREEEMRRLLQEQREEQEAAVQLIKDEATAREETEKQISEQMETLQAQLKDATQKLEEEYGQKISVLETEHLEEKKNLQEDNEKLKQSLQAVNAERDEIMNQAEESRKKLESLHHEEMFALRQELETHVQGHKEKMQRIQVDLEATRASRSQLMDLKEELVARNAAVEQVELLRAEFSDREQQLASEHEQLVEKLKEEHENELTELRKQLEEKIPESGSEEPSRRDLEKELEEYKEKLSAAQANLASLASSSPMRPISAASEYGTANLSAMNKDIRDALTITHISDVSGIGDELEEGALHMTTEDEMIEEQLEEGDLPTLEEGDLIESKESQMEVQEKKEEYRESSTSSSSSSDEYSVHEDDEEVQEEVRKEHSQEVQGENIQIGIDVLKQRISELETELHSMTASHRQEVESLTEKYETLLADAEKQFQSSKDEALKSIEDQYTADKDSILQKHEEAISAMEEEKQNDMMQLRLKCASETASQVEEELTALRKQLENSHKEEMESMKLALEVETSEKINEVEKRVQEKEEENVSELAKLSEEHSRSMEEKISAIMAELYEQKQESFQKLAGDHQTEIQRISEENEKSLEEKEGTWKGKHAGLEQEIERLNLEIANAKCEYQNLANSLEAGDNEVVKSIQLKHVEDLEKLKEEFGANTEIKLKQQAQEFEQAQSDYVKQHQERLDKFLSEREEDIQQVEKSKRKELEDLHLKYQEEINELKSKLEEGKAADQLDIEQKFEEDRKKLQDNHNEELKAVATKLVEIKEERDELLSVKEQLQQVESEQEQAQAELKDALIAHHMEKFQAAITELDQHHLEEMEKLRQDHERETEQYKKVAEDLIQKMKNLEEEYKSSIMELKEDKASSIQAMEQEYTEKLEEERMDHGSSLTSMREAHEAQMQAVQEEHEAQLNLIEEEIATQDRNHRGALDNLLQSQATKLEELQQQFDLALTATKAEGEEKAKTLTERVAELEKLLKGTQSIQTDLESAQTAIKNIEEQSGSWTEKEEQLTKKYQGQIEELSASLEAAKEELQEMGSKIEFERAEYESEMDQLQDDIGTKDENIKELESELEKNTTSLNAFKEKFQTVTSRREREGMEEDNLIHMLRDDLDRLNDERDQLSKANQQLLATLTELVQANHKCEDSIAKRLQTLQAERTSRDSGLTQAEVGSERTVSHSGQGAEAAATDSERSSSASPKLGASTGSFEDEGLDLSQRLAESMFAGPELDTSARDVAVGSGTRLQQAVERLLDALQANVQQLNVAQQPQIILGDVSVDQDDQGSRKRYREEDDDDTSSKSSEAEDVKKMEGILADYMNQQLDLERRIQEHEEEAENLRSQAVALRAENSRLQEEVSLVQKQKEAFTGGGEAELNLIKLTEELSSEKQAISDQYEASRIHFEKQSQQLEAALEAETKKLEEKEKDHSIETEDLHAQIDALQKQILSNSKFSAEQTSERELEREQFQEEIDQLQGELERRHDLHRSDSKLSEEVSRLEEEMEARDLAHQETVTKMKEEDEKMRKTLQEYKENLDELREKESEQNELDVVKGHLQDMTREREVIQQELYDNLLKVSALEAKLDQYKHNGDIPSSGAGDPSQIEQLKMNLDQERETNESKIEHLVGIHSQLRNEIIEKEEEIESLLQEIENYKELEAENIKLKEDLKANESGAVPPPSSRAEELGALSRQLLEEKNAEIDELQTKLQDLENQKSSSSSSDSSEEGEEDKDSLNKLKEENLRLQSQLQEMEEKLISKETIQHLEAEVSGQEEDSQVEDSTPLEQQSSSLAEELNVLKQENEQLKTEIQELRKSLESVSDSSLPLLGVSPETKEKIRHLEELLEKEKDSGHDEKDVDSSLEDSKKESFAPTEADIEDKLEELANELKTQPKSILGRILATKDEKISEQDQKIRETENTITEQNDNITKLQDKVSGLEHTLSEPDVKVRLKSKVKDEKEKEIDVEKDSQSSHDSESEEFSSTSSSGEEAEESVEDVHDGQEEQSEESPDKSSEELKILLDQREKELEEKEEVIENNEKILSEKHEECKQLQEKITEMGSKCEELQKELDLRLEEVQQAQSVGPGLADMTDEEVMNDPGVQSLLARATNALEQALKTAENDIAVAKEEKQKLVSELGDVQREYMALIGESQTVQEMEERQGALQDKINDLESLVAERETELQQFQQETDDLQTNNQQLMQDIEILKRGQSPDDAQVEKLSELQDTLARKVNEFNRLLQELQQKEETIDELQRQIENSKQQSKAHEDEIELLQNEQQILNSENDRLQQETEEFKTKVENLEHDVVEKQELIANKEKEIAVINKERFIEPRAAMLLDEGSLEEEDLSMSSIRDEDPDSLSTEELIKMHESKMEDMKNKYSQALTRVVEDTRKQLLDEHETKIREMQEKHKREMTEILAESFSGESEMARRLRQELDIADQLDQNLMGHLASVDVPENVSDANVPSTLQSLLDRVHNEGVQVLTLSELQFLKHYQKSNRSNSTATSTPPATVEEAQQTSIRLEEDMTQLRKVWENEKLALLNAIHALKELVTQTNPDTSTEQLQESEDARGDLLNAVSDVFEKERDALIAELQTSVVEAQQAVNNDPDETVRRDALEKLKELEKKLQEQGSQHAAALERLMNTDREALLAEIKDLRNDRKQNSKQAEERIQHLESQLSNNHVTTSQNIHILQSQVERLEYKLQQERALAADVRSTLEAERVRAEDYLPALQRERDRSVELDQEIGKLQKRLAEDAEVTRSRTENLQTEVDDNRHQMDDLQTKLTGACQKLIEAEQEAEHMKRENDRARIDNAHTIKDLKRALMSEENRREALTKSLEAERNNVAQLHEELATLRADSHEEIETQKIRLAEQADMITKEKNRTEDVNSALLREQETSERLRNTLEEERTLSNEARQHDRATVTDLQRILDDAKKETERLQKKMDTTERETRIAKQQLEDAREVHQDAIEAERAVRDQLQSALDAVQEQIPDFQNKVQCLEEEVRRQNLANYMTGAGVPPSSSTPEGLMAHRRQLESLRQRLQLESTKLQDLMSKTAQRLPITVAGDSLDQSQDAARVLASEMEQVDSVKRSLGEMQQELKEMYSALSVPKRGHVADSEGFNDRLMEQNAELVSLNTRHTDEKMALRDALRRLEEEVWKARAGTEDTGKSADKLHQQQVQEMASRMHRLYVRYLRAESFRKALVYQKKYLLLLIGGFQDCEEATLALVARMGAYPGNDAYGVTAHRSVAFKRFRSAARVVMAVSRLKFLVRKSNRTSHSVSASIKEKHGATPLLNGRHHPHSSFKRSSRSVSPNLRPISSTSAPGFSEKSPSPTPLPQYRRDSYERPISSYEPYRQNLRAAAQLDTSPTKLTPETSYGASGARPRNAYTRSSTSPYLSSYGDQPSATALRYLNGDDHRSSSRPRPRSYHSDYRTPDLSSYSYTRTQPGESDPSLNEYIQKLENLHHRLEQNPHRYQR